jgi:cation transport ATPase
MKLPKQILLLSALVFGLAMPALAQVEQAAMRTTGISCGVCAVVSEVHLRAIAGVDKVTISKSAESVVVSYKPGALFQPAQIRKAVEGLNVGIAQFQISARGRVQDQSGKRFFVAGRDRFVLTSVANAPKVPSETPVMIEGVLNDRVNPMELRILTFKPVRQ